MKDLFRLINWLFLNGELEIVEGVDEPSESELARGLPAHNDSTTRGVSTIKLNYDFKNLHKDTEEYLQSF